MVTRAQIIKWWIQATREMYSDNPTACIDGLIREVFYKMTEDWGECFLLFPNYIKVATDKFPESLENERRKVDAYDLINILKEKNPVAILDDGRYEVIVFFENAIIPISIISPEHTKKQAVKIFTNSRARAEEIREWIPWKEETYRKENKYKYLCQNSFKMIERDLEFSPFSVDIERNYNNDIPHDKMISFLRSDESGIVLLHGEPGTGKSSYIKHLISQEVDKKFVIITPDILKLSFQESFIQYFIDAKKESTIFILEDCEKLLMKREKGASLETILNLSDGILGSTFKTKFICSFNTDLSNIDKAILRKGRLKVRYEFKKLSLEKTKLHIPDAIEGMTLAEIYNQGENEFSSSERKRVGF